MKKFNLLFAMVILLGTSSYSNPIPKDTALYEKVNQLQKDENIKLLYESKFEQLKTDYENYKHNIKIDHDDFKAEIKSQTELLKIIGLIFGPITLIAVICGWVFVSKAAKGYADKRVKETIDNLLVQEKQKIVNIVNSHDVEYQLKENSKILVLSTAAHESEFEVFFNKLGFKNVEYKIYDIQINDISNFDMIFFNNEDRTINDEQISHYYNSNSQQVYFILGIEKIKLLKNMNCSNSRISMYSNLISTLKYQYLLYKN